MKKLESIGIKRLDIILIAIYIIIAIGLFFLTFLSSDIKGDFVEIYLDNKLWARYELPQKGYKDISVIGKGKNIVRISSEGVCIIESSCSGQFCVHQGCVNDSKTVITCLPNGLLVQIVGRENDDIDMVSY